MHTTNSHLTQIEYTFFCLICLYKTVFDVPVTFTRQIGNK